MKTSHTKIVLIILSFLYLATFLKAEDLSLQGFESSSSSDMKELNHLFTVADSLLFANKPEESIAILTRAQEDSLFTGYLLQREINFKIYDIYSYQWDFSKSIPQIKGIFLADSLYYHKGLMANSSLWVASTYTDNNDYDNAMEWINKSRLYATEADSTRILAYLYMLEGDVLTTEQNLYSAFEKYQEAEKFIESFPISNTSALIYLSLASIYASLEQQDVAIKYYEKTIDVYNAIEDYSGVALAMYNLAIAYGNSGDNETALQYSLESIQVCQKEMNKYAISDMLASCYSLTSQLYERLEDWDNSLKYLELSDELVQSNTAVGTTISNMNQYIRFYTKLNNYEKAWYYVQLGDSLKTTSHTPFFEGDFLNARLEFYDHFGFYEEATHFARQMISNIRKETSEEVANLIAEFEAQKNIDAIKQEKQKLTLENTQKNLTIANQHKTIYLIVSLILFISIITIIIYQRYISKTKLAKLLNIKVEERTKELKQTNEKLLAEIQDHLATTNLLLFAQRLTGIGEIASGLAHEIRNPLTNILVSMQILKSRYDIGDDEFTDIIIRNAQNANIRISELLNYSQPIDFKKETISLHLVIKEVINLVRGKLNKDNIKLAFTPKSKQDLVSIDKKQINTVFLNFILNSIDAINSTDKAGIIEINTYDEFNFIVVDFIDNGCGIESKILPKIFQPFFTNKEGGTGLGLNLAHKIIHQHGGIIEARSQVGVSTTITVKLLNIKS
ncbi:tetratricopeptide repeat protein [bacterium]|nr:tetratricopeptide repeat protein [bacterium]